MKRTLVPIVLVASGCGGPAQQPAVPAEAPASMSASQPTSAPASQAHGDHGAHGHHGHHEHEGHQHHFDDPTKFEARWNAPERDAWQKPGEIVAALELEAGMTVVDLGSGTGYLVPHLARAVGESGRVIAQDVEPAMVEYLKTAAQKAGWANVSVLQGEMDDPALAPASVDRVVTLNVWHHVNDRSAFAEKLARALKPGGSFIIVDFLKSETEGFGPPMAMRLTADTIIAELKTAGFTAEVLEEAAPRHYIVRARLAR